MSNALAVVQSLQSNMGSMILANPQSSSEILPPVQNEREGVLFQIRDNTKLSLGFLSSIYNVLIDSFKFDLNQQRLQDEQATELEKEKGNISQITSGDVGKGDVDVDKSGFLSGILGAVAGMFTGAAILGFTKAFLGKLLAAGFFTLVAEKTGDYITDKFPESEFAQTVGDYLPMTALAAAFFGKKGIMPALLLLSLDKVVDYVTGQSDEITKYDFATLGISTLLTANMLKGLGVKLVTRGGTAAFLGGALTGAIPFAVAGLVALALGLGVKYINEKGKEYESKLKEKLSKDVPAIEESGGFLSNMGDSEQSLLESTNLNNMVKGVFGGDTNITDTIKGATTSANREYMETGFIDSDSVDTFKKLVTDFDSRIQGVLSNDRESTRILKNILSSEEQTNDFIEILTNLRGLALNNAFGEDSPIVLEKLLTIGDNLQSIIRGYQQAGNEDILSNNYLNDILVKKLDILESIPERQNRYKIAKENVEAKKAEIAQAKNDGKSTKEIRRLEGELSRLEEALQLSEKQDMRFGSVSIDELQLILGDRFTELLQNSLENKVAQTKFIANGMSNPMPISQITTIDNSSYKNSVNDNSSSANAPFIPLLERKLDNDIKHDY